MNRRKPVTPKNAKKKAPTKSRRPTTVRKRTKKAASPAPEEPRALVAEVAPAPDVGAEPETPVASEPAPPEPLELDIPLSTPETIFAERVTPPELERPYPATGRATL